MWRDPIYDRTQADVDNRTAKAYLNIGDLNRIEENIQYLSDIFTAGATGKAWNYESLPTVEEFERILENIDKLKAKWPVPEIEATPTNPINTFEKVNMIERLINEIYTNYRQYMTSDQIIYCGEIYAGDLV